MGLTKHDETVAKQNGLSITAWSKEQTADGYLVRAGQILWFDHEGPVHCEKVAGVKGGKAYSTQGLRELDLAEWRTTA